MRGQLVFLKDVTSHPPRWASLAVIPPRVFAAGQLEKGAAAQSGRLLHPGRNFFLFYITCFLNLPGTVVVVNLSHLYLFLFGSWSIYADCGGLNLYSQFGSKRLKIQIGSVVDPHLILFFSFCGAFLPSWILIRILITKPDPDPQHCLLLYLHTIYVPTMTATIPYFYRLTRFYG